MAKMKMKDMLVWGAIAVGGIVALDYVANLGILNSIKGAMVTRQSRVSYYDPRVSNAYIGTAYGLGQQSMRGDYNGIPAIDF